MLWCVELWIKHTGISVYIRERRTILVTSSYPKASAKLHLVIYNSFQTAHLGHSTVNNKAHAQLPEHQQFGNTFWVLIHQILEQVTNKARIWNSEFADTLGYIRFPYTRSLHQELRTLAELAALQPTGLVQRLGRNQARNGNYLANVSV